MRKANVAAIRHSYKPLEAQKAVGNLVVAGASKLEEGSVGLACPVAVYATESGLKRLTANLQAREISGV